MPAVFIFLLMAMSHWANAPNILDSSWKNYEPVLQDNLTGSPKPGHQQSGLRLNFEDENWTNSYNQYGLNSIYDWVFTYDANGETAILFPGQSKLQTFGSWLVNDEDFFLASVAGVLLAIALTILLNQVRVEFGWLTFLIALVAIAFDGPIYQFVYVSGNRLLTSLVVSSFAFFTIGIRALQKSQRPVWTWPVSGALLGATTLFQFQTSIWLLLILVVWLGVSLVHWIRNRTFGIPIESIVLFWIGVLVVAAPWWIRNCKTTGELKPLGYSVSTYQAEAYSDEAIAQNGNLDLVAVTDHREQVLLALADDLSQETKKRSLVQKEAIFADGNKRAASQWISDNSSKLGTLIGLRLASHFELQPIIGLSPQVNTPHLKWRKWLTPILLIGGLFGCLLNWRRWGGIIFGLIFASAIVVSLTWSDHGRYLIPLRPLIDVAFAMGGASLLVRFAKTRNRLPTDGIQT